MRNNKGVSLLELMITLAVFSIIITMIYSVYNTFLKTATAERKAVKTEMDVFNVSWPFIKEIALAGFGVPSTSGTCSPPLTVSGNVLTIHSTAAGDAEHAGKWGYVVSSTCVISSTDLPISSTENNVVVINNLDKGYLGGPCPSTVGGPCNPLSATAPEVTMSGGNYYLTNCSDIYEGHLAYWTPCQSAGELECYETSYYLYASATAPAMCAPDTLSLGRKVSKTAGGGTVQPILDCVRDLDYRFGCINASGNLIWRSDTNCLASAARLRLIRVGMIIQSSPRRDIQVPTPITLFEDLGAALRKDVDLSTEQRSYKWRKLEQTITLKNLPE